MSLAQQSVMFAWRTLPRIIDTSMAPVGRIFLLSKKFLLNSHLRTMVVTLKRTATVCAKFGNNYSYLNIPLSKNFDLDQLSRRHQESKNHSRSRTERLLRNILRRKQCILIFFAQIALLIILIIITISIFYFYNNLNEKYLRLNRENKIIAEYEHFSTFFSCRYYPPTEYDVSECGWASDESAFMVRFHRRRTDTHKCASKLDMIPCDLKYPAKFKESQNLLKAMSNTNDLLSKYRPCSGIFNNSVDKYGISPQTTILAPKIKITDQFDVKFMLRPKDFIMRCPICMISSQFSSGIRKDKCTRSLRTLREGWPQYAALCDEIENHPFEEFCNTYDAILNKIHGTTASIVDDEADYDEYID